MIGNFRFLVMTAVLTASEDIRNPTYESLHYVPKGSVEAYGPEEAINKFLDNSALNTGTPLPERGIMMLCPISQTPIHQLTHSQLQILARGPMFFKFARVSKYSYAQID